MKNKITELIEESEYTASDFKNNCIGIQLIIDEGKFHMFTKAELKELLEAAFEGQRKVCRAYYQINRSESSLVIKDTILTAPGPLTGLK